MRKQKSNTAINETIKIQGTNYDRKRKVTKAIKRRMEQMHTAGKSYKYIGDYFGFSPRVVRYNLDEDYKTYLNKKRNEYARNWVMDKDYKSELADYKRTCMKDKNFRRTISATI